MSYHAGWVVLDRDGVINVDRHDYVRRPDEFVLIPGSVEAIAALSKAGFGVAVATNQAGVGRGLYSEAILSAIHDLLDAAVVHHGGKLAGIFYCPHAPDANCDCRKPKAGLLDQIQSTFDISLAGTPFVGDSTRDMEAALSKQMQPVLVKTGKGEATLAQWQDQGQFADVPVFPDLITFSQSLLRGELPFA